MIVELVHTVPLPLKHALFIERRIEDYVCTYHVILISPGDIRTEMSPNALRIENAYDFVEGYLAALKYLPTTMRLKPTKGRHSKRSVMDRRAMKL